MTNFVKDIYKFNREANLLQQGYNSEREVAYAIEEAIEDTPFFKNGEIWASPKTYARVLSDILHKDAKECDLPTERQILDKHLDIIVFSLGSLFKLGLSPQMVDSAMHEVCKANNTKLNAGMDEKGKLLKPANWSEVEERLNKGLDKIIDMVGSKEN